MSAHPNGRQASGSFIQRDLADEPDPGGDVTAGGPGIDLEALAKKIYALLKEDLRIERERKGWHRR